MKTKRRGLLTTGCHQTVWSADNRLSPALGLRLLTTSCIFSNYNVYPIQQYQTNLKTILFPLTRPCFIGMGRSETYFF